MIGRICGTGSYAPPECMSNDDLAKLVDTSDAWIQERTGIVRRHIAKADTAVSMAVKAAKQALENAGLLAEEVELIVVATASSEAVFPCTACEVQKEIGAVHAACFDLNAACSGFLFAYNTAQAYIAAGMYKTALLIGAEALSHLVNWQDRGTCILFGDGAGAAVLKAEEGEPLPMVIHSDGMGGGVLTCERQFPNTLGAAKEPEAELEAKLEAEPEAMSETMDGMEAFEECISMDGRKVFEFAVKKVPEAIRELLAAAGLSKEDIGCFVLHQANRRIVEAVAKRLEVDRSKFPINLGEYGNTSAASIPILLDELNREEKLAKGSYVVLAGFGAGLSWGASLLRWQM